MGRSKAKRVVAVEDPAEACSAILQCLRCDPFRASVQACCAEVHSKKKSTCVHNPNCLFGLGENSEGIWALSPETFLGGTDPRLERRLAVDDHDGEDVSSSSSSSSGTGGSWHCSKCGYSENLQTSSKCVACETRRSASERKRRKKKSTDQQQQPAVDVEGRAAGPVVLRPVGISNLGATCYVNSLLQVLFCIREFREGLYAWSPPNPAGAAVEEARVGSGDGEEQQADISSAKDVAWLTQLQLVFARLDFGNRRAVNLRDFARRLGLNTGVQQDPHEFNKLLTNKIDTVFKESPAASRSLQDLVPSLFTGARVNIIECMHCHTKSPRKEFFGEIQLHLSPHVGSGAAAVDGDATASSASSTRVISVEECLRAHRFKERLEGSNQYQCNKCCAKQDAERYVEYDRATLPRVLTLQIMRFIYDMVTFRKKKLCAPIHIPRRVDLADVLLFHDGDSSDNTSRGDSGAGARRAGGNQGRGRGRGRGKRKGKGGGGAAGSTTYELRAVLKHKGTQAHAGHYVVDVYDERTRRWWHFDDDQVTQTECPGHKDEAAVAAAGKGSKKVTGKKDAKPATKKRGRPSNGKGKGKAGKSKGKGKGTAESGESGGKVGSRNAYVLIYVRQDEGDSKREREATAAATSSSSTSDCADGAGAGMAALKAALKVEEAEVELRVRQYTERLKMCQGQLEQAKSEYRRIFLTSSAQPGESTSAKEGGEEDGTREDAGAGEATSMETEGRDDEGTGTRTGPRARQEMMIPSLSDRHYWLPRHWLHAWVCGESQPAIPVATESAGQTAVRVGGKTAAEAVVVDDEDNLAQAKRKKRRRGGAGTKGEPVVIDCAKSASGRERCGSVHDLTMEEDDAVVVDVGTEEGEAKGEGKGKDKGKTETEKGASKTDGVMRTVFREPPTQREVRGRRCEHHKVSPELLFGRYKRVTEKMMRDLVATLRKRGTMMTTERPHSDTDTAAVRPKRCPKSAKSGLIDDTESLGVVAMDEDEDAELPSWATALREDKFLCLDCATRRAEEWAQHAAAFTKDASLLDAIKSGTVGKGFSYSSSSSSSSFEVDVGDAADAGERRDEFESLLYWVPKKFKTELNKSVNKRKGRQKNLVSHFSGTATGKNKAFFDSLRGAAADSELEGAGFGLGAERRDVDANGWITCPHGQLNSKTQHRMKISRAAWCKVKKAFPKTKEFIAGSRSGDSGGPCRKCTGDAQKQREEIKAARAAKKGMTKGNKLLRDLQGRKVLGYPKRSKSDILGSCPLKAGEYRILPRPWMRAWRSFLKDPNTPETSLSDVLAPTILFQCPCSSGSGTSNGKSLTRNAESESAAAVDVDTKAGAESEGKLTRLPDSWQVEGDSEPDCSSPSVVCLTDEPDRSIRGRRGRVKRRGTSTGSSSSSSKKRKRYKAVSPHGRIFHSKEEALAQANIDRHTVYDNSGQAISCLPADVDMDSDATTAPEEGKKRKRCSAAAGSAPGADGVAVAGGDVGQDEEEGGKRASAPLRLCPPEALRTWLSTGEDSRGQRDEALLECEILTEQEYTALVEQFKGLVPTASAHRLTVNSLKAKRGEMADLTRRGFEWNPAECKECVHRSAAARAKQLLDFRDAVVHIQRLKTTEAPSRSPMSAVAPSASGKSPALDVALASGTALVGSRRSSRRSSRRGNKRSDLQIKASSTDTVMDIRLRAYAMLLNLNMDEDLNPQQVLLYYDGREMAPTTKTLGNLGVRAGSIVQMRVLDASDARNNGDVSDFLCASSAASQGPELGFKGTLLLSS